MRDARRTYLWCKSQPETPDSQGTLVNGANVDRIRNESMVQVGQNQRAIGCVGMTLDSAFNGANGPVVCA